MTRRLKSSARHITETNGQNSMQKFVGANGEINASSQQDLLAKLLELSNMVANGQVFTDCSELNTPDLSGGMETAAVLEEAFHDGEALQELGNGLAAELNERMLREGFMRNLLSRGEVAEGSIVRVRVRTPNVRAVVSQGVGLVYPQFVRDRFVQVNEFEVSANPRINELDMHQGSGDILEDKFSESQEAIMVGEDRTLHSMMSAASGIYNTPIYFAGAFTPTIARGLIQNVSDWQLPATTLLFPQDIMSDMLVGTAFSTWFDPISKYEIVQTGNIGTLLGMSLLTDSYREPTLKVLSPGEVFCTAAPQFLGSYTDRGPVRAEPVNSYPDGAAARGWFMYEHISCLVANAKAVSRGQKQ